MTPEEWEQVQEIIDRRPTIMKGCRCVLPAAQQPDGASLSGGRFSDGEGTETIGSPESGN